MISLITQPLFPAKFSRFNVPGFLDLCILSYPNQTIYGSWHLRDCILPLVRLIAITFGNPNQAEILPPTLTIIHPKKNSKLIKMIKALKFKWHTQNFFGSIDWSAVVLFHLNRYHRICWSFSNYSSFFGKNNSSTEIHSRATPPTRQTSQTSFTRNPSKASIKSHGWMTFTPKSIYIHTYIYVMCECVRGK